MKITKKYGNDIVKKFNDGLVQEIIDKKSLKAYAYE